MSEQPHTPDSFLAARQRHNISLTMLIEDLVAARVFAEIEITFDSIQIFDRFNIGRPEVVDVMLASLSRLSGTIYHRENVGRIDLLPSTYEQNTS
ncbi:MAG TPA: hypothetical protein VKR06_45220 [Ktedonosporobacter sp.]|nr:hypothetical protein [Ktedonosporobacter sp.]